MFRVSPGVYSIDDPIAATIIYNVNKVFRKSRWYYAAGLPDETKVNAFATDNEKINAECRRKLGPTLSQYITYEPHCNTCLQLLLQKLRQISAASPVIDLGWWLTCYAFDVSGMITVRSEFSPILLGFTNTHTCNICRAKIASDVNSFPSDSAILIKVRTLARSHSHSLSGSLMPHMLVSTQKSTHIHLH